MFKTEGLTLEEYLQKYYGLKGPLYRKRPLIDREGCRCWWTVAGQNAYDRFVHSIYDLEKMANYSIRQSFSLVDNKEFDRLIRNLDFFEYEDPYNG